MFPYSGSKLNRVKILSQEKAFKKNICEKSLFSKCLSCKNVRVWQIYIYFENNNTGFY